MTEYKLKKLSELRLEVAKGKDVYVSLQQGTAEIFGAELSLGQRANLAGQAVAVFTWDGCTLTIEGEPDVAYVAEETPMAPYINAHHAINNLRNEARAGAASAPAAGAESSPQGPRVVVAGPSDVGKSSLCRMLLNWGVRGGHQPTYVDLDVGQGTVTAPGCLAATPVEHPIDIEEGYPTQVPLVFFFGHASPADAPELYKYLTERLASVLERRAESSPEVAAAGMVVNTLGWVEGLGYDLLLHAVAALKADVVLVLEQDRLYNQLKSALAGARGAMGRELQVVKLAKSGGIVARTQQARKDARLARVREYFYGRGDELEPHAQTVAAEQLQMFRIGGGFRAPSSALPLGATSRADPLKVAPAPAGPELTHSLLAVSHAAAPDQIAASNVAGFVLLSNIDAARGAATYLAPCGGPLPGRYLVAGSLKAFLD
ncbi:MAG: Pre-mRNA cleavage complex II protein Clp1-domain-containing protein [Monoraphidium minutum]|nr:MAG: Pre-mRNA cleavage complex II protein Clp1-domain-containing protein [Monoraphidium minutum]